MTRPRWPCPFGAEFPGPLVLDFSGRALTSTAGCEGVAAAGAATPLSAAGGGALARRAGGACGAGTATDGMRASSRLSCGGWVVSGATCSTTVIKPRGRGTAGERNTAISTPATKTTQPPPTTMAANDKRSRCVRAINPIQKITAVKSAAVLSRDHNCTRRRGTGRYARGQSLQIESIALWHFSGA